MAAPPSKDPLHGVTLEMIVTELVAHFGWEELAQRVRIRCFSSDPSVRSSLTFLRRTPWARAEVESLYLFMLRERRRSGGQAAPEGGLDLGSAEGALDAVSSSEGGLDKGSRPKGGLDKGSHGEGGGYSAKT